MQAGSSAAARAGRDPRRPSRCESSSRRMAAARPAQPQSGDARLDGRICALHILPRLGDDGARQLTPKRLTRFRAELERAGVGTATVVKAMTIVQSILSFAVSEDHRIQRRGRRDQAGVHARPRAAHFLPRGRADPGEAGTQRPHAGFCARLLGPRPEEVVCRLAWDDVGEHTIRYVDTKRRRVRFAPLLEPLAEDLKEWFLASGRPTGKRPAFPAHDTGFWNQDDWRNWRMRTWRGEPERPRRDRKNPTPPRAGCAPAGTRPRDLRSSYATLRVYEGVPLTRSRRRSARACG